MLEPCSRDSEVGGLLVRLGKIKCGVKALACVSACTSLNLQSVGCLSFFCLSNVSTVGRFRVAHNKKLCSVRLLEGLWLFFLALMEVKNRWDMQETDCITLTAGLWLFFLVLMEERTDGICKKLTALL
ncbi:MAG: hypothetical protein SH857_16805 [Chitinophagales bacterium]|nr:hypothetical protein [Chitinophagales bacterium]